MSEPGDNWSWHHRRISPCQKRATRHEASGEGIPGPLSCGVLISCRVSCCLSPAGSGWQEPWMQSIGLGPPEHRAGWDGKSRIKVGEETEKNSIPMCCLCHTCPHLKYSHFFGWLVGYWLSSLLQFQLHRGRDLLAWPMSYPQH